MRNYENIGYDAFNSYRSGDENSRRNRYGNSPSNERGGSSVYGRSSRDTSSADHNFSTEPGFYGTGSAGRNQQQNQPQAGRNPQQNQPQSNQNYYENQRYQQSRPQSQGSWEQQNRGNQYSNPSQNWQDRQNQHNNWADRAEDRIERWGDKIENAWERWSGDDNNQVRQNWMNHPEHYPTYSHGNASGNRYSENYDNSGNRFENRGNYGNQGNRREYEDEGFFDNLGHRISNAWDRWVGNDEEEERRYQNRSQYPPQGRREDNRNPYGQSSRRGDNEW